jgi:hypothetical protein
MSLIYLCPVCESQPIYDSDGIPLSGESVICECCSKYVCVSCVYTAEDRQTMYECKSFPKYIYEAFLDLDEVCMNCITNNEKDYIDSEDKKENLPLHINTTWLSIENLNYFLKKLKKQ